MILEKNKVYKIRHQLSSGENYKRNYLIFAPREDVILGDDYFYGDTLTQWTYDRSTKCFFTIFTCCFDGDILTMKDGAPPISCGAGIDRLCKFLPLTEYDYKDVRKALDKLGGKYLFNRKTNKLMTKNDTKSEALV